MNRRYAVPRKKPANVGQIIKRLFSYLNNYKLHMIVVCILIIVSSIVGVLGNAFVAPIIDDHILPLAKAHAAGLPLDFSGLYKILLTLACIYIKGIISCFRCGIIIFIISNNINISDSRIFCINILYNIKALG